jgi:hypothetical protein
VFVERQFRVAVNVTAQRNEFLNGLIVETFQGWYSCSRDPDKHSSAFHGCFDELCCMLRADCFKVQCIDKQ